MVKSRGEEALCISLSLRALFSISPHDAASDRAPQMLGSSSPFLGEALEPGGVEELRDTETASRGTRPQPVQTPAWNTPQEPGA